MDARRLFLLIGILAAASPAAASEPQPSQMIGCVIEGFFINSNGYRLRPRAEAAGDAMDLTRFEGRSLLIDGALLPGDAFILKSLPRDVGPCPDGIRQKATKTLPWAWVDSARRHRADGDLRNALIALNRALELDATLCVYGQRAEILEAMGRIEEASADASYASAQPSCRDIDRQRAREMLERLRSAAPPHAR
jgi:hypothetical protein